MTPNDSPAGNLADFLLGLGFVAVPLHVNAVGHFELAAAVNGHDARLVLDTGASHTVFATASAERFGLTMTPSTERAHGVGASNSASSTITVADLRLGAAQLHNVAARAIDLGHVNRALESRGAAPVDGALGADLLRPAEAIIDYARATLYLRNTRT